MCSNSLSSSNFFGPSCVSKTQKIDKIRFYIWTLVIQHGKGKQMFNGPWWILLICYEYVRCLVFLLTRCSLSIFVWQRWKFKHLFLHHLNFSENHFECWHFQRQLQCFWGIIVRNPIAYVKCMARARIKYKKVIHRFFFSKKSLISRKESRKMSIQKRSMVLLWNALGS